MTMARPGILAFAASARAGSFNKKLVKIAATGAVEVGADVTVIDLHDFPMPLYDGDLEQKEGIPPNARKIKDLMNPTKDFLSLLQNTIVPFHHFLKIQLTGHRDK